jgi:DMSO reductase family type II enzyme heme b subunit
VSVAAGSIVVPGRTVSASLEAMLPPTSEHWDSAEAVKVALEPTPLDRQPSAYVRTAWKDRRRGDIREVVVSALCGSDSVAIRLEWAVPRPQRRISDINVYADACAVLLPLDGKHLEHDTMGSPEHPVQAWHWRAGAEQPFEVMATGLGTVQRSAVHQVSASARWDDGRWQVVLGRPMAADGVKLTRKGRIPVAFAVWSGVAGERAGLKAYSPQVHELVIGG